tara:strand:+ start:73 stop:333 length:261 start_codon:yes stop_codon:yes gene_type:complete
MRLIFHLSGSVLYSTDADCVPPVGAVIHIKTEAYKKGLYAGSVISVAITGEEPPVYDYSQPGEPTVHISVNGYEVLKEGPEPPDPA